MTPKCIVPFLLVIPALLHAGSTTITLASSANPAVLGHAVKLTAVVTPSSATGVVTFYSGTTVLETEPLVGGMATLTTILLPFGSQSLKAYYLGDANDAPSTSAILPQTVNALPGNGFQTELDSAVSTAYNIAMGDFNGDGKADLIVFGQGVGVLLGNGDGTFQAPVFYNDGGYSSSYPALADFNGDGHADIAVLSSSSSVSVLLGNADGTFETPKVYVVSTLPLSSLTAGDFNGDGKADLVLATGIGTGSAVIVLLGNGDGTFQPALTYSIDSPASIGLGDFNGDGKTDLVITSWNTFSVSVALGNGDGTFQPAVPCTFPQGIYSGSIPAVGDFNGDGKLDFAVTNPFPSTVAVLLGNGDGTFQPAVTYASTPQPGLVEIGDFNGDGKPDLVTSNYPGFPQTTGSMNVLLGNGDGTFQPQVAYSFPVALGSAVVGEFNGDGTTDLAATFQDGTLRALIAVTAKSTTTALTPSPNPSIFEQSVTLTATVSPASATGAVTFYDGSAELGTGTLNGGAAELAVSSFTTGAHSLKAVYGGDPNDLTSTSAVVTQTVDPLSTSTILTSAPNPSTFGQSVTLKATVSPATATGTVTFYHGSTSLGTSTLTSGKATLAVSTLTVGAHALTATYSGDENDATSTSPSLTQTVGKAPTTTTLTSLPNPSTFRQSVTLSATVTPSTATGTVTFYGGTTALGTATLSAGTATLTLSTLSAGPHSLTATYSGDANDTISTSSALIQIVRDTSSTILTSSPNPSDLSQSVMFTALVSPSSAAGTVTFYHGSASLGTSTLSNGKATLSVSTLSEGSHAITATYNGSSIDAPSTSTILTQVVN